MEQVVRRMWWVSEDLVWVMQEVETVLMSRYKSPMIFLSVFVPRCMAACHINVSSFCGRFNTDSEWHFHDNDDLNFSSLESYK